MIEREISPYLKKLIKKYPVITITGPRQSGKTYLAKNTLINYQYVNLEDLEIRSFAKNDPKGFFKKYPGKLIIDEIQRVPELTSYIQVVTDEKNQSGQFVLTGSQNFQIMDTLSQSLAGRTANLTLLPFSFNEIEKKYKKKDFIDKLIFTGFYPRIYDKRLNPTEMLSSYVASYVERDLKQLSAIKNLDLFQRFMVLCAGRVGQLLNLNNISNDLGVSSNTLKEWLSLLRASYIIFLLQPFHPNINKRLVKSPKLYFYDVGLVCYLLGIDNEKQLKTHPLRGQLFENLIVIEVLKHRYNNGLNNNLSFYRDSNSNEIDLIYQTADRFTAIEIKSTNTIRFDKEYGRDIFKNIENIKSIMKNKVKNKVIIYSGDNDYKMQGYEIKNIKSFRSAL